MKEVFNCYASEGVKLIDYLNQKKEAGYIITFLKLKDGLAIAQFEKSEKEFVYSLDYSKEQYRDLNMLDEYFDIAKLNGWKLQCFTDRLGIWVNENVENAVPFLLEDEYREIENDDCKKRMRSIKLSAIYNLFLLILTILIFILYGDLDVFYGLPFFFLYAYSVLMKKKNYSKIIIETLSIYFFTASQILSELDFIYAIIIEIFYIIICIILLQKNSFILKKGLLPLTMYFWAILFILLVIYGG